MKIALFLPTTGGGGAEKMQVHLANALASRGHSVDLVVANARGPSRRIISGDVRLVDFQRHRTVWALLALSRYLRREQPDVLVSALAHANITAIVARFLVRSSRTRLVATERNAIEARLNSGRLKDRAMLALMKLLYPLADKVVGISRGVAVEARSALRLRPEQVTHIYNPVVTPSTLRQIDQPTGNPRFDELQKPIVITVGRLAPQKDQVTLISAFPPVARARNANLVILGDGPQRPELEAKAKAAEVADRVHFLGFVENPLAYLRRADLFVLSSKYEGLANVLVEALACGLPIVSTDCPSGPQEVLDDGRYGRLVPVGDTKALSDAMLAALDAETDTACLRARAQDFSADKVADQYEDLFEALLHRSVQTGSMPL